MIRSIASIVTMSILAIAIVVWPEAALPASVLGAASSASAATLRAGEDVCPEPNDDFQHACSLGTGSDALGFIARPDDVDAYRFEMPGWGLGLIMSLEDLPNPYQVTLVDWKGDIVAESEPADVGREEALVVSKAGRPGSYYLFVHSRTGAFSDSQPYRLHISIVGLPEKERLEVVYQSDYRPGVDEGQRVEPTATFTRSSGRLSIRLTGSGTPDDPLSGIWTLGSAPGDVTVVADVRIEPGPTAGFRLFLGRSDDGSEGMAYTVDVERRRSVLEGWQNGQLAWSPLWHEIRAPLDPGVHRAILSTSENKLLGAIDGQMPDTYGRVKTQSGGFGIAAVTWGDPATVHFDNVLVVLRHRNQ